MNETNLPMDEENAAVLERTSPDTAGSMLRTAREKAGLHIAALAVAIKIPVKKLEALEADQLLGTHDLVFTRALASSVCRTLKIDPKPVLAALPQTVVRELLVDGNGVNTPFIPRVAGQSRSVHEIVTQPWVMLVLVLCVGAAVIAATDLWGHKDAQIMAAASGGPAAEEVVVPQTISPIVIPAPVTTEAKSDDAGAGGAVLSQPLESTAADTAPATTLSVTPGGVLANAPAGLGLVGPSIAETKSTTAAGVSTASDSNVMMVLKARQQSVWVKVVDAKGEVRLSRNIAAGERIECGGVLPLTVVLGRADSVDVEVRGKSFDFSAFTRENVARFEVK